MRKSILIVGGVTLAIAIALGIFHLGRGVGSDSAMRKFEKEAYFISKLNAVADYVSYAEMAAQLSNAKVREAKCTANVVASTYYRQVKECLQDKRCNDAIYDEVQKHAPELLDGGKLKFTYYENMQVCSSENPDLR